MITSARNARGSYWSENVCGIVGVLNAPEIEADESTLRRMLTTISYRGPDASGTWVRHNIGLGHVRLSILDLSANANQPFKTDDGLGVLVYNGEVYNFRELRMQLELEGVSFRSTSDTEVVLQALHRWGPETAIPKFNGMFAIAYCDLRTNALWLARDRMGIKPLYLADTPNALVFASEIRAILQHPHVPTRADLHSLTTQILCEWIEEDWTPFEGIRSIGAGHIVRITKTETIESAYFDPLTAVCVDRLIAAGEDDVNEFVDQFATLLTASIAMHLVSDAPLAAMCSGGVDSSLIAAIARDTRSDLTAYVADVKGTISEGEAARRMGAHLGIALRQVDVDRELYLRLWPLAVWHNGQPNFFPNDPAFLAVALACRDDGFKVLLTGEGADEFFGGYHWHAETWRMHRHRRLFNSWLPSSGPFATLRRLLGKLSVSDPVMAARMPFRANDDFSRTVGHSSTRNSASPYLFALTAYGDQGMLRHENIFAKLAAVNPIEERAFLARTIEDMYGYLRMVLQRNDRMGMAASIESRVPFIENGLIDFALHLPFRAKYQRTIGKWVVRKMATQRLPEQMVYAPKIGFSVPATMWMPCLSLLRNGWLAETLKWTCRNTNVILERLEESPRLVFLLLSTEIWGRLTFFGGQPEQIGELLQAFDRKGDRT